jgi:LPS-assembly lipoprotein
MACAFDRRRLILWTLVWGLAMLAGCGFQLRGQAQLPFTSAWVDAAEGSVVAAALRRSLTAQDKLAERADQAGLRIRLRDETRAKNILALSGGGKVREYRLEYRVQVSAYDAAGVERLPPSELSLFRDFSYSDAQVLAKEAEEAALWRAMEQEAARQILRRLAYLK